MADKNITETVISLEKEVILLKRELKNILDLLKGGTTIPPKVSELSVRVLDLYRMLWWIRNILSLNLKGKYLIF